MQRRTGLQSRIELHPIVAVRGAVPSRAWRQAPALSNMKLFVRDRLVCAYCGHRFPTENLTREHIRPSSRGGLDSWMNCITACRGCNGRKGNRTPEEAQMNLLYLPYVPSLHEDMILRGRRILADQRHDLGQTHPITPPFKIGSQPQAQHHNTHRHSGNRGPKAQHDVG